MMSNNYQATIRVGSGQTTVTIQANSLVHARQLLEMQYGTGMVFNLHQH
jgi:hypothetical protein